MNQINEINEMNEINQINETNQINQDIERFLCYNIILKGLKNI